MRHRYAGGDDSFVSPCYGRKSKGMPRCLVMRFGRPLARSVDAQRDAARTQGRPGDIQPHRIAVPRCRVGGPARFDLDIGPRRGVSKGCNSTAGSDAARTAICVRRLAQRVQCASNRSQTEQPGALARRRRFPFTRFAAKSCASVGAARRYLSSSQSMVRKGSSVRVRHWASRSY